MSGTGGHMNRTTMIEKIKAAAEGNRLSCERAHDLANEMDVSLQDIGKVCNELKIKISNCRLGCF
jgi:hypothetical protein